MQNAEGYFLFLATVFLVAGITSIAAAIASTSHSVGGTSHGHWAVGDTVHAWTDHDHDTKHASVDHKDTFNSICSVTSAFAHVHCERSGLVTTQWHSHHWGPHISDHIMVG